MKIKYEKEIFYFFDDKILNSLANKSYYKNVLTQCIICGSKKIIERSEMGTYNNGNFYKKCFKCGNEININWSIKQWYDKEYKLFEKASEIKDIKKILQKVK